MKLLLASVGVLLLASTFTNLTVQAKGSVSLRANPPGTLQGIQSHAPAVRLGQTPVTTPAHPPLIHLAQFVRNKGVFLFYSFNPSSSIYWHNFSPSSIINQAQAAGVKYLEIRLGYSNWLQIEPGAQQSWLNHLLDLARSHGIRVIGWVVPYTDNASANTVQTTLNGDWQVINYLAHYKTPVGGRLSGLAMDLELGPLYFGGNTGALARYVQGVRSIVGPSYPLVSIVPDPARTALTSQKGSSHYYPYNLVAAWSNVLQPMAYWHEYYASAQFDYTPSYVEEFVKESVTSTQEQDANASKPINLALQFYGNPVVGYPSPSDLLTSLQSAKNAGSVGISCFQWHTLSPEYWNVLSHFVWRGN